MMVSGGGLTYSDDYRGKLEIGRLDRDLVQHLLALVHVCAHEVPAC